MAKFADLPPEIAEEIVYWVNKVVRAREQEEVEAMMFNGPPGAPDRQPPPNARRPAANPANAGPQPANVANPPQPANIMAGIIQAFTQAMTGATPPNEPLHEQAAADPSDDDLPLLESVNPVSAPVTRPRNTAAQTSRAAGPASTAASSDSDDEIPPLEDVDPALSVPAQQTQSTSTLPSGSGFFNPPANTNPFAGMFSSPNRSNFANVGVNAGGRAAPAPTVPTARAAEDASTFVDREVRRLERLMFRSNDETGDEEDEADDDDIEDEDWETEDETAPSAPVMPDFRVDPSTWSYLDGLPSECTLPLALVSRSFLYAARKVLYGQTEIVINGAWQLSLLVRTLTDDQISPFDPSVDGAKSKHINRYVNGLNLHLHARNRTSSGLGRGGMQLVVDAINACPQLKCLVLSIDPLRTVWKPLSEAIHAQSGLQELHMSSGQDEIYPMIVSSDRIAAIAASCPGLARLYLNGLAASLDTGPMQPFALNLTDLSLMSPRITGFELEMILAGSTALEFLSVVDVPMSITRSNLAQNILKHAGTIKGLTLAISPDWHPRSRAAAPTTSSELSPNFLNTVVSKMKKLSQLDFAGPLANSAVFALFPNSLSKLKWANCPAIEPSKVAKILATVNKQGRRRVPKLSCVSIGNDDINYTSSDLGVLRTQLNFRSACLHLSGETMAMPFDGEMLGAAAFMAGPFMM